MQIRKGTADDIIHIRALTERATNSTYLSNETDDVVRDFVDDLVETSTSTFTNAIKAQDQSVYVATRDDELLGYVIAIHDAPEIRWIVVDPAAHGTGAGKALMIAALDALADQGVRSNVRLTVAAHNERAKAFYRKFGFMVTGPVSDRSVPTVEMQRAA
ncbi:GNAT family N-acetyltransferase [Thalassospira australica]|uniref:GNAT family N-acetyltransferase n=1 Tax=Thalassospira australica TaxID=1528106 RepID=UPI000519F66A|nr:GNAT family N-acetyltransferase [Thalassospira australica]